MLSLKERYIIDKNGEKIGVFLDISDYEKILEELEELEAIRACDEAKSSNDEQIPFEDSIDEIEKGRK